MTDYNKILKLFIDAFDVGVNSERYKWDTVQMRQITCTTMMKELLDFLDARDVILTSSGYITNVKE
jgi:hypothetical protein